MRLAETATHRGKHYLQFRQPNDATQHKNLHSLAEVCNDIADGNCWLIDRAQIEKTYTHTQIFHTIDTYVCMYVCVHSPCDMFERVQVTSWTDIQQSEQRQMVMRYT